MSRDANTTEKLLELISRIKALTTNHELQWERQDGSAHRYACLNNNLLILGPDAPLDDRKTARYLFITPLDSPQHIEINSQDEALGPAVLALASAVESVTANKKPVDPFALTADLLKDLTK